MVVDGAVATSGGRRTVRGMAKRMASASGLPAASRTVPARSAGKAGPASKQPARHASAVQTPMRMIIPRHPYYHGGKKNGAPLVGRRAALEDASASYLGRS